MRKKWILAAATFLVAAPAWGHSVETWPMKCPLCGTTFSNEVAANYSIAGAGPELRPLRYIPAGYYAFCTCPSCFYSARAGEFDNERKKPRVPKGKKVRAALAGVDRSAYRAPGVLLLETIDLAGRCAAARGANRDVYGA